MKAIKISSFPPGKDIKRFKNLKEERSKIINKKLVKMATKHFSWSSAFSILLLEDTDTFPYVPKI